MSAFGKGSILSPMRVDCNRELQLLTGWARDSGGSIQASPLLQGERQGEGGQSFFIISSLGKTQKSDQKAITKGGAKNFEEGYAMAGWRNGAGLNIKLMNEFSSVQ